jgi:hypothetical protein
LQGVQHIYKCRNSNRNLHYRKSPPFICNSFQKRAQKSKCKKLKQETYMLERGFCSHCLKVHKNPYLWGKNKPVSPKIMVHSCMNSTKLRCWWFRQHKSEYPPHFWWLYKGWPMKLTLHKQLVTFIVLFKKIISKHYVTPYHAKHKICIATTMIYFNLLPVIIQTQSFPLNYWKTHCHVPFLVLLRNPKC